VWSSVEVEVGVCVQGASAVVFCIGGPYGHGPQVRERANVSVKLSAMVLNHQVAFLVLLEQIYRSASWRMLLLQAGDWLDSNTLCEI
jgi:23S rRNA pseudoU1915 N3-methylase RlmH